MRKLYCNLCGKEFGPDTLDFNNISIHTFLGYGSKYDDCVLRIDFCSKCMDMIIDKCEISPIADLVPIHEEPGGAANE